MGRVTRQGWASKASLSIIIVLTSDYHVMAWYPVGMGIAASPNETPAGRLARTYPELSNRERNALLHENGHRECDPRYQAENMHAAYQAIVVRAEDAGTPELYR